ncbi:hypothetical protein SpiGrapes_1389 [Sphaerochaeta pleomorpha str. Grapes]|uniref:Uncharacterized protein n=1 Tax=Sphaerochaeta pleomorpha (strain ATCC BAA-1885 / DSM 22778 / Grapes) TaxID=158190 RepID=G8QUG7_SPHPG|nr:hypothetical protein SpiGrapes_1389 [Sphaerochaeta pleomorpha str. Grapes]
MQQYTKSILHLPDFKVTREPRIEEQVDPVFDRVYLLKRNLLYNCPFYWYRFISLFFLIGPYLVRKR